MWQINFITGIFLFVLGLCIIKFKMTYLIAGYNTSSKKKREKYDKDKLVNFVGNLLIASSIILLFGSLFSLIFLNYATKIYLISNIIFILFIIIGVIYLNVSGCTKIKN
jgi:hypothetical protein